MQGRENAPDLVKACIKSVEDNLLDFNIVILCENNIKDYINVPEHMLLIKNRFYNEKIF